MILDVVVDGIKARALFDTGSMLSFVSCRLKLNYFKKTTKIHLLNGSFFETEGNTIAETIATKDFVFRKAKLLVVKNFPSNIDIILGLDAILKYNISIENRDGKISIVSNSCKSYNFFSTNKNKHEISIDEKDFEIYFQDKKWVVKWKWSADPRLENKGFEPTVKEEDRDQFYEEVDNWIEQGILVTHDPVLHGPIKHYLPIFAVRQQKGNATKVRPVFDYRRLNENLESHQHNSVPICSDRLRQWRQQGYNAATIDLKRAYLQINVHSDLWTYQAVRYKGKTYLLTKLGFGLSTAPSIMTTIVEAIINTNEQFRDCVSSYIDDIFINCSKVNPIDVKNYFLKFGLSSKDIVYLGTSANTRVLGLSIDHKYHWKRDSALPTMDGKEMTRRQAHGIIGEWLGHFPVAGWVRLVAAMVQRTTAKKSLSWNEPVGEEVMKILRETDRLIKHDDPVKGKWCVNPESTLHVWTDASNLAVGVVLEIDGNVIEDACWLNKDRDTSHINMKELDAAIRGINLALRWDKKNLVIHTDSKSVYSWLSSTIDKTQNIRTKALNEMLIKRRLENISQLIEEYNLKIKVTLVPSQDNKADKLTRLPKTVERLTSICDNTERIVEQLHNRTHFGIERTTQLASEAIKKKIDQGVVKKVVENCDRCSKIDPTLRFSALQGSISATRVNERWCTDVTYIKGKPFLSIIDNYSRFTTFFPLKAENAIEICSNIELLISILGPPEELLADNGTVFHSKELKQLSADWEIRQSFSCAYRSRGNGIIERVHREIKRSVGRTGHSVAECVFWHNNSETSEFGKPYNLMFSATSKIPGICPNRANTVRPETQVQKTINYEDKQKNPFLTGDLIYLRDPSGKCDRVWSGPHRVSRIISRVSFEINDDGISRHINHARVVPRTRKSLESDDEEFILELPSCEGRYPKRNRKPPDRYGNYIYD